MLIVSLNLLAAEECTSENKMSIPSCMKKCEVDSDCSFVTKECFNFPVNIKFKEDASRIVNSLKLNQCLDTIPADCKFVKCISKQCIYFQQSCAGSFNRNFKFNIDRPVPINHVPNDNVIKKAIEPVQVDEFGVKVNVQNESYLKKKLYQYVEILLSKNDNTKSQNIFKKKLITEKDYLVSILNSNLNDKDIISKILNDKKDNVYLQAHLIISLAMRNMAGNFYHDNDFKSILTNSFSNLDANELISIIETPRLLKNNVISAREDKVPEIDLEKISFKRKDSKIIAFVILKSFLPNIINRNASEELTKEELRDYTFYFKEVFANKNSIYKNILNDQRFEKDAFLSLNVLVEKNAVDLIEIWKNSRDLFGSPFSRSTYYAGVEKNNYLKKYILTNIDTFINSSKSEKEACNLLMVIQFDFHKFLNKQIIEKLDRLKPYKYNCLKLFSKFQEFKKSFQVENCNIDIYSKYHNAGTFYTEIPLENCSKNCKTSSDCSSLIPNACYNVVVNRKFIKGFTGQKEAIPDNGLCSSNPENSLSFQCIDNKCISNEAQFSKSLLSFLKNSEISKILNKKEILACDHDLECREVTLSRFGTTEKFIISSGVDSDDYYFDLVKRFEENGMQVYINSARDNGNVGLCIDGMCAIKKN